MPLAFQEDIWPDNNFCLRKCISGTHTAKGRQCPDFPVLTPGGPSLLASVMCSMLVGNASSVHVHGAR